MISKSSTWEEANAYFDEQIESHFDKKPTLSETFNFLEALSIEFIHAEQYCLAIACISAIKIYKNAGDIHILKAQNTNQTIRTPPKALSQIIFKEKLTEKGGDAKKNKNLKVAFEIYNMVAEIDPGNIEIWEKRFDALSELLHEK